MRILVLKTTYDRLAKAAIRFHHSPWVKMIQKDRLYLSSEGMSWLAHFLGVPDTMLGRFMPPKELDTLTSAVDWASVKRPELQIVQRSGQHHIVGWVGDRPYVRSFDDPKVAERTMRTIKRTHRQNCDDLLTALGEASYANPGGAAIAVHADQPWAQTKQTVRHEQVHWRSAILPGIQKMHADRELIDHPLYQRSTNALMRRYGDDPQTHLLEVLAHLGAKQDNLLDLSHEEGQQLRRHIICRGVLTCGPGFLSVLPGTFDGRVPHDITTTRQPETEADTETGSATPDPRAIRIGARKSVLAHRRLSARW